MDSETRETASQGAGQDDRIGRQLYGSSLSPLGRWPVKPEDDGKIGNDKEYSKGIPREWIKSIIAHIG